MEGPNQIGTPLRPLHRPDVGVRRRRIRLGSSSSRLRTARGRGGLLAAALSAVLVGVFLLSGVAGELRVVGGLSTGGHASGVDVAAGVLTVLSASSTATPSTGSTPLVVAFKGSASGGSSPYTYSWTFGGTTTSTSQNPSHTYLYSGSYVSTLTVTDAKKATAKHSITIKATSGVAGVAGSLVAGSVVATTPSSFFSIDAVTNCAHCIASNSVVNSFLNSTPFEWVRYGVDSDRCNASANKEYSDSGVASVGCAYNVTSLKTWCNAQTPHCHSIMTLPGENNNSAEDAAIAKYIVKTVGFQPDYWAIGNEPTEWSHYGIAWSKWKTTDASKPTPLAYAFDVKAAITAVTAVDSAAKFIGLEAACSCNTEWFQDVAKIDGAKISAVAYHSYPSYDSTTMSTSEMYTLLSSSKNVTSSYAKVRTAITGSCTGCSKMPIFINEFNSGPGWAPSTSSGSYANALFLAASVTQALRTNVSQLSIYDLQTPSTGSFGYSMMDAAGTIGPTGILFSKLLNHLVLGQVLSTGVKTTVGGVWSVVTKNGASQTLMVVNTNLTMSLALSLSGGAFPLSIGGTIYQWNPSLSSPTTTSGLPASSYSIPPQGILLITI